MQELEIFLKNHPYDTNVRPSSVVSHRAAMHKPLLNVNLGSSMLTLRRVTVSVLSDWFASGANCEVDGTIICRERGCEGVERPMTSGAASNGKGNMASLQTYKVCALLCTDNSSVLIIYLASCPTSPDSCKESGRTASGRGDHSVILITEHSLLYNRDLHGAPNTASNLCSNAPFKMQVVLFQCQQDHHSCHTLPGLLYPMKQDKLTSQGSVTGMS